MRKFLLILLTMVSFLRAENVYATFNVVAQREAKLAFVTGGVVDDVKVDIGSIVKKGSLLATLNHDESGAILQDAKTTYRFAKRDFERQSKIKKLIDEGVFDKVVSLYEKAKNDVDYKKALYDKTFLKSPFDGVIYYKDIEVGDGISGVSLKTVFKIQSEHRRKLILEFDQKYNKLVKIGQTFEYKLDGDDTTYRGIISKIYPYADFNNRKIRAEVKAKDIIVGLFGNGYILVDTK